MLNQRLIIDKDLTTLQRQYRTSKGRVAFRKYKEMPTNKFIAKFGSQPFVLPQNTRYHQSYGGDVQLFVTEYQPQMRTIRISINMKNKWEVFLRWCERNNIKIEEGRKFFEYIKNRASYGEKKFQLLFPYLVMISVISQKNRFAKIYMFMNQKPLVNSQSLLHKIPMYNTQRDQSVCLSSAFPGEAFKAPIADAIDMLFKSYFNGGFNSDYRYNLVSYRYRQAFNNYFIWAFLSQNDPFKIFEQKLIRYRTLETVLKEVQSHFRITRSGLDNVAEIF